MTLGNRGPRALVDALVDRYNAHDIEGVVALYAEDSEVVSGERYLGKEAIRGHFEMLSARFGEGRIEPVAFHEAGEVGVLECILHGRMPNGRPVALPMAMVFRVVDGLIREDRAYADPGAAMALAGAAAEPARGAAR